ncbi:hypothetical protein [Flavobacterium sp.]|uniref:hypothetical protein n=1 Tax=Flavobacterium sp. TaxID=239 RepID=UPI003751DAAE
MRNKSLQWKYGYNEQIDTVIISKDGTLGEIYNVQGLNIGFPEKPDHKLVSNWDKTEVNQKWAREKLPDGLNKKTFKYSKYQEFISNQFAKRDKGTWLYIKGKPVYLTGTYWFFLQWVKIEEGYPTLRLIQNELMIFWEACKADNRCYGMQYVKNRRMGASSMAVAEMLETGTIYENKKLGIISKTGEDAGEIFERIVTAFRRLPPFFKPETEGSNAPKKELSFKEQSKRGKSKDDNEDEDEESNNTSIKWYATAKNSMDGKRIFRSLIDESGKFPKHVPFDRYWNVVKTSHQKGRVIFGKAMVVSTVNPMEEGGQEYFDVWNNSDVNDRNDNGSTKSGLYRIFIKARFCLEGFFDVFGFSIVDNPENKILTDEGTYVTKGSVTWLHNELEAKKKSGKPGDYNEQLRQFPESIEDAFRDSADSCAFALENILENLDHNKFELEDNDYGNNEVERGNLYWKDGVQDGESLWKANPENGRFWIAKKHHPSPDWRNKKSKKTKHGVEAWSPLYEDIGCFGVDPFNRSTTVDGRGSKGSIHLFIPSNTIGLPNNTYILEYIDRPARVEDFYEDVILVMNYFSMPMLPEFSSDKFSQFILDRGYRHFVKNNPFVLWKDLSTEEQKYGGVNAQNGKIIDRQFHAINTYINDHVGLARDHTHRKKSEMGFMPFSRTLRQWKNTDPNKRTKFDAYISSSLALIGTQTRMTAPPPEKRTLTRIPFARYDNSGSVSIQL